MPTGSEKRAFVMRCACAAAGIVLLACGAGWCSVIEIGITGQVTNIFDTGGVLGGQVNIDDVVTGLYRFDSSTLDTNPLAVIGDYQHNGSSFGIFLDIGGLLFTSVPEDVDFLIQVSNDYDGKDGYLLSSSSNQPILGDVSVSSIRWQLEDESCTALNSDILLPGAPVLTDWQSGNLLSITCRGGDGVARIEAVVTVPEPASVVIFMAGAAYVAMTGKRRQQLR